MRFPWKTLSVQVQIELNAPVGADANMSHSGLHRCQIDKIDLSLTDGIR